jgi:hypothetical protein
LGERKELMDLQEKLGIDEDEIEPSYQVWMRQVLVIGAVLGALTGVAGAYLLIQRSKEQGTQPTLDSREGIRLGLIVLGLLRQVALIADEGKQK